ncbi:MAG: hypothetical protein IKR38_01600 [Bacteroidales bacterium]|nr:hypothetical protein [Bacteroidales bacterium]
MKKIMLLMAALTVSGSLFAQDGDKTGMEWIEEFEGKEKVIINPNYGGPSTDITTDSFYLLPMDEQLSALYGSRYSNAQIKQLAGISLVALVTPMFGTSTLIFGLSAFSSLGEEGVFGILAALSAVGTVACLATGIPLWVSGDREMNSILDDYSRNYAPRPYSSSLSFGPTASGVGLALKF